jgi:transcription initiation factor TFIIF subunit beta
MDIKTARLPENEVLDLIFRYFEQYRYWPLRALRQAVKQPEAYLRATLEKVADLHRSGPFANCWELKPENRRNTSATEAVKATDAVVDTDSDGDDDVDTKMEDVV